MIEIPLTIGGSTLRFYVYANIPNASAFIQRQAVYFARMPTTHLSVLDPFLVVDVLPGHRRHSGGYYTPAEVNRWFNKPHTGVSNAELQRLGVGPANDRGIIAITTEALISGLNYYTVIHEAAHSVDYHIGIVPSGATLNDLRGVRYPRASVGEYAAEAYARFIINHRRICRSSELGALGENQSTCSRRLIGVLRQAPAFNQLAADWLP